MATRDGQITAIGIAGMTEANRGNLSTGLWGYDPAEYLDLTTGQAAATTLHQQRVINYPTVFTPGLSGQITGHYAQDYYHRIHIIPNPIALGNLLSEESRDVYVWNAFFEPKALDAVTRQDADGISLDEPVSAPCTYAPLEEQHYIVNVSVNGPPTIDASIYFEFAVYTITLAITGSRVTLFVWPPQGDYTERLQWRTNILRTRVGEQRIALRDAPRQAFDFKFLKDPKDTARLKIVADNWTYRTWGLPVWKEMTAGIDASIGATAINFDTRYADYREDGLAVLWESTSKAQAVRVTNVRPDGIDIDPALEQNWSDAFVMPLRKAITPEGFGFDRGGRQTRISVTFLVVDNADLSETSEYDTYRSHDVLTDGNIIIGDMSERIHRPLTQIDNGQGPITIETTQDYTNFARTVGKYTKTMAALWQWRKWLHSRYGKQKAFWLPTWNPDIILAAAIASPDIEIEIKPVGLSLHGQLPVDAMLRLTDGSVFYRRINNALALSNGNEQITIDSAFGQEIQPEDVDLWCFMDLVRFNADAVELQHHNPYKMNTNIPVMRVPE